MLELNRVMVKTSHGEKQKKQFSTHLEKLNSGREAATISTVVSQFVGAFMDVPSPPALNSPVLDSPALVTQAPVTTSLEPSELDPLALGSSTQALESLAPKSPVLDPLALKASALDPPVLQSPETMPTVPDPPAPDPPVLDALVTKPPAPATGMPKMYANVLQSLTREDMCAAMPKDPFDCTFVDGTPWSAKSIAIRFDMNPLQILSAVPSQV